MNDDEVQQWLDAHDGRNFRAALVMREGKYIVGVLRALAETRKALWCVRLYDSCWCVVCGSDVDVSLGEDADGSMIVGEHRNGCIFATMPRPK